MRLVLSVCSVVVLVLTGVHTAGAQVDLSDLPPSYAPQIEETQRKADEATVRLDEAETELGDLETQIDRTASRVAQTEGRVEALRGRLREAAVSQYVSAGTSTPSVIDEDLNRQVRNNAIAEMVTQHETDVLDEYRAAMLDLEHDQAELDGLRDRQREVVEELEGAQADMLAQLQELEDLEDDRQAEIARREEAERARQAELARQEAARQEAARQEAERQEAARQQAARQQPARATTTTRPAPAAPPTTSAPSGGGSGGGTPSTPPPPAPSGGWICPVQGPHSFVDSWGAPRSGGRRHRGVDMMANIGVPVVAPVSGTVSHRSNSIGGLSFHLNGDDGHYYYGTHLSAYGASGRVQAGTVIGYVGDTGNARGIPHLHFEIHPNGGSAVNPYPTVRANC